MANVTIGDLERVQSISDSDLVEVETSTGSGSVDIGQLKQHINEDVEVELGNKVDKVVGKGLSTEDYTSAEKQKLAGLENYDDTIINNRLDDVDDALDTKVDKVEGKQLSDENFTADEKAKLSLIENYDDSEVRGLIDGKVDKVAGKGLSTNDFTDPLYDKLASLEGSRWKGVFTSLSNLEAGVPNPEAGDYADVDTVGEAVVRYIWDNTDEMWVAQTGTAASLTPSQIKQMYESNPDTNAFKDNEKAKLEGIEDGATANSTDAYLLNRANHTGVQEIDTVAGLADSLNSKADQASLDDVAASKVDKVAGKQLSDENFTTSEKNKLAGLENYDDTEVRSELSNKVDKESGKGLSTNDFTDALRDKLVGLEGTHWRGTFVSLSALQSGVTDPAAGDYADVDEPGADVERYIWDATDGIWVAKSGEVAPITASQVKMLYESNPDTNAFSDAEKDKLGGIEAGAQVNEVTSVNGRTGDVEGLVENTDQRLTDAREWSADTVTQAEAEAGTGTTRRAWTAQRVRQAIVAWWDTIGTAFGKTLLGSTDADAARQNLGLGAAATKNVGTDDGNVMEVGAFGIGKALNYNPDIAIGDQHIDGLGSASHGSRVPSDGPDLHIGKVLYVGPAGWGTQLWFSYNESKAWFRNKESGKPYESWKEFIHSGNIRTSTGNSTIYPMSQKAVTDALNTKASTSTQVIAGTGLSGGGNLSANRTLSVNYGTTAGTAAQGNDPRLSDSREWSATTISQEEAEAGTATTRRAWTAQRVRQAIMAWWNSSSDKTKLDGIEAGATANSTDAVLLDRANHTGTQAISTVAGLQGELDAIGDLIGDIGSVLDTINGEVV